MAFRAMLGRTGIRGVSVTAHADDSPTGKLTEAIVRSVGEFRSGHPAQALARDERIRPPRRV